MARKIEIRQGKEEDIRDLLRLDTEISSQENWPEHRYFTLEHFKAYLEIFPEGFLVALADDALVGYAVIEIIEHDINNPIPTWEEATDNGFIRRTHNPRGNTGYGVSVCTARNNFSVGKRLIESMIEKFKEMETIEYGAIGSRVAGYHKVAHRTTIEEYVYAQRENGLAIDSHIAFYQRCGFQPLKILPNYIEDPLSLNYGVLMIYPNPNYKNPSQPYEKAEFV